MRRTIVIVAVLLLTTIAASAKDLSDWSKVRNLKLGTEVRVVTATESFDGRLTSVTDTNITLDAPTNGSFGVLSPRVVDKVQVLEVYKLGKRFERRLSGWQLMLSSTAGVAAGIGIGAAVDAAHPSYEDPGQAKLVGGVLGAVAGPAILAVGRSIYGAFHRTKLLYRAPGTRYSGVSTHSRLLPKIMPGTAILQQHPI